MQSPYVPIDFSNMRVGVKTLEDATLNLGQYRKANPRLADKEGVLRAINNSDIPKLREISNFFYKTSGIYSRLCRYMAFLYRYDWMVTPYIHYGVGFDHDLSIMSEIPDKDREKYMDGFFQSLKMLDDMDLKKLFGDIALKVIRNGCYYGYIIRDNPRIVIQELPVAYCRSRFYSNGNPAVEFNMQYFDTTFPSTEQRTRILKMFPKDFEKGYKLYKQNKLTGDFPGDSAGWYLLDTENTIKFNLNGDDFPPFISVIPAIIDLDAAQDLDRRKMAQKLLKIIIQKMPIDKNGDLVFDIDEAQDLHNNAVQMLKKAIGVDVLTTFADVDVADMADRNTTTTVDDLSKVERTVYNEAGVSQLQFNSSGNIALNNSISNDEASMKDLILQFENFINRLLKPFNKKQKNIYFKAQVLNTTIYNYKDMAKLYKEQTQLGYSKMLAQIALGQSQSSILANAYFENNLLNLSAVFIPPMSSNTMNADVLLGIADRHSSENGVMDATPAAEPSSGDGAGRPEKEDNEKSEKTIQNRESAS